MITPGPRRSPVRLIVLDFDGTIIESNEVKTEAFRSVFARFPEHQEAAMAFHMANAWKSRFEKIDFLLRERLQRGNDEVLRKELLAEFAAKSLEQVKRVPYVRGALAFLEEFSPRVPLYLASVTPQEDLDATIAFRGLGHFFRGVYGCPPWTKVGAVQDAVTKVGCETVETLLIGDAPGDLRAAAEAGVGFLGIRSGIPLDAPNHEIYSDFFAIADSLRDSVT